MSKGGEKQDTRVEEVRAHLLADGLRAVAGGEREWAEYGKRCFSYLACNCRLANERTPGPVLNKRSGR